MGEKPETKNIPSLLPAFHNNTAAMQFNDPSDNRGNDENQATYPSAHRCCWLRPLPILPTIMA